MNCQRCYRQKCAVTVLVVAGGCSRHETQPRSRPPPESAVQVIFPESALVNDSTVNDFVRTTIEACTSADYEQFRSLWSATEEPFTRDQFERGWQKARKIEIHKIQAMRHPKDGSILYYVHAGVELAANVREPKREVVLLIVKQDEHWRLARAPESVVKRVLKKETKG